MKRKERKEIKEDELTAIFMKITDFFSKRKKEAIALGILIVFVLVLWGAYSIIEISKIKKDNKSYVKILELSKTKEEALKNSKEILALAKNGILSSCGYFILSEYYIEDGKYNKALSILKELPDKKNISGFKKSVLMLEIFYSQGKYNDVVELYRAGKLNKFFDKEEFPADELLYFIALSYEKLNQIDGAKAVWEKIKSDYPYSDKAMIASRKLME